MPYNYDFCPLNPQKMYTSKNAKDIAQQFCQALGDRDLTLIMSLLAEDLDWYIPGNQDIATWTGRRSHRNEIRAVLQDLWNNTEPLSVRIDHVLAEKDFAVITGEFSTRMLSTMKIVESIFSIHITVKNDLIVRYRLQEDSFAVVAALQ